MSSKLDGLPDLGYGPAFTEQAPVPHNDQAGAIWNTLADTAQKIGDIFQPELDARAAQQGAAAVTRDANGNLTFTGDRTVLTKADAAYMNAAQLAYLSKASMDVTAAIDELKAQHAGDPNGFKASLDGLIAGNTRNAPEAMQQPLTEMYLKAGAAAFTELSNATLSDNVKRDEQTVNASIDAAKNELFAYARQGNLDNPRAQDLINQLQNQIRAKVHNPAFVYSQAQAEQDIGELQGNLKGEAILGHVDQLYTAYGEAESEARLRTLVDDPALNLKPTEREQYYRQGLQEIRQLHSLTLQTSQELQRQVEYSIDDATAAGLATGDYSSVMSDDEVRRAYSNNPAHAEQIIGRLHAATETHSMALAVANATPAQLAAMDQKYRPTSQNLGQVGSSTAPAPPANFNAIDSKFVAPHEGGYGAMDGGTNFGISQNANPDVNVKDLTPDAAARLRHDRYWVPSGADKLPPALAAVQYDTAINFGVAAANDMLKESGGDVQKYLDIREQRHRDIAANDPAKAQYLDNWLKRDQELGAFVQGGAGTRPDVADQLRVYTAFQHAVTARNLALANDPAGYVLQGHQDIGTMMTSDNPAIVQTGVRKLLATERDLGAPIPTILPKSAITSIVSQFNNPPDPAKKAETMIGVIGSLERKFGAYYPQVMGQLIKGGLPADAIALDWVKDDPVVAARMANAVNTGLSGLTKLVSDPADVDKAVRSGLSDFNASTHGFGGSQVSSQMFQSTQLYAYQLVAEGVDPDTAAKQAVSDMVGKHFTFQDGYRVPTGVDPGTVSDGAAAALNAIDAKNLEPYGPADPGATLEDRQRMSASILKSQGEWVTLPDNSGLALVWPAQTGYLQARTLDKKPIRFTWAQLNAMSHSAPAAFNWGALLGFGGPQ